MVDGTRCYNMNRQYDIVYDAIEHGMSANPNAIVAKLEDKFFPTKNKRGMYVRRLIQYLEKDKCKIITHHGRYYKTEMLNNE